VACPKCAAGKIIERRSKKGRFFYGCDQYPGCDYVSWDKPAAKACPECTGLMVEKRNRSGARLQCTQCEHNEEVLEEQDQAEV
jgi:DNA topoisomerase-1